jgi:hypothetical protein
METVRTELALKRTIPHGTNRKNQRLEAKMIRKALLALALAPIIFLSTCTTADPGPYKVSGTLTRTSPGTPDNCLVGIYDAASVNITTALPVPLYSTTVDFAAASVSFEIDNIPSGTYYIGAFLGVDSGTAVNTAESGYGGSSSYANPFSLLAIDVKSDLTKDIGAADWIGFP